MKNINMVSVMKVLELDMGIVQPLLNKINTDENDAQRLLTKFKLIVRKQRRLLAKKYHPDVYGDSGERMKEINNIVDLILRSKIMLPQPQVITVRYSNGYAYSYNYDNGATTATSTWQ